VPACAASASRYGREECNNDCPAKSPIHAWAFTTLVPIAIPHRCKR
jgi:hypothetical protein